MNDVSAIWTIAATLIGFSLVLPARDSLAAISLRSYRATVIVMLIALLGSISAVLLSLENAEWGAIAIGLTLCLTALSYSILLAGLVFNPKRYGPSQATMASWIESAKADSARAPVLQPAAGKASRAGTKKSASGRNLRR